MPALLIRQRVFDENRWRQAFDGQAHARAANGCQDARIYRTASDPTETIVILTWDSLMRARLFAQSDDLRESLSSGADHPDIWVLDDDRQPSGA